MARVTGFIQDTQTQIIRMLQAADFWSGLKEENAAMNYFANVTQADLDAIFGTTGGQPNVTKAQYQSALSSMQAVVDGIHAQPTAGNLYRLLK